MLVDIYVCTHDLWISKSLLLSGSEAGMTRINTLGELKALPAGSPAPHGEWSKLTSDLKLNDLEKYSLFGN